MISECEHEYLAPNEFMRICQKCNHIINIFPVKYMTLKEFKKNYPFHIEEEETD